MKSHFQERLQTWHVMIANVTRYVCNLTTLSLQFNNVKFGIIPRYVF